MAKLVEDVVVIKVSRVVRDNEASPGVSEEFVAAIEAMAAEVLADPHAVVEVIVSDE